MKKKLIQILMLLVGAVSVGSFVSCKDTNEDLYNELRTQTIAENATLRDALNQRIDELAAKIAALENWKAQMDAWKATVKSCGCPDDVAGLITGVQTGLQGQIDGINDIIEDLAKATDVYTKAEIDAKIATLQSLIDGINTALGNLASANDLQAHIAKSDAAFQTITQTIADLQVELEKARCECDPAKFTEALEKLATLEAKMVAAEANITTALADAATAKETAARAEEIAKATTENAKNALEFATKAKEDAAAAVTDAAVAKTIAEAAKSLAESATETANKANLAATEALTKANMNETAIQNLTTELQNNTKELRDAIDKNKDAIADNAAEILKNATNIDNNAKNIQKNAEDIQKIQNDLTTIKTDLTTASDVAKQALQDAADAMAKATQNETAISLLTARVAVNEANITNLQDDVKTLQQTVSTLVPQVTENKTKIENLENSLKTTNDNVTKLTDNYTKLSNDLTALQGELDKAKTECALNLENAKLQLQSEIAALELALVKQINDVEKGLRTDIDENAKNIAVNANDIEWIKTVLDQLGKMVTEKADKSDVQAALQQLVDMINQKGDKDALQQLYNMVNQKADKDDLNHLGDDLEDLEDFVDALTKALNAHIADCLKEMGNMNTDISILTYKVDDINQGLKDYVTKAELIDALKNITGADPSELSSFLTRITELETWKETTTKTLNQIDKQIDQQISNNTSVKEIEKGLISTNQTVSNIQTNITNIGTRLDYLNDRIDNLVTRIQNAEKNIANLGNKVKDLTQSLEDLQKYLGSMVTGITIQGTYNTMFGSFYIPGVEPYIISAYYGEPKWDGSFPTKKTAHYIDASEALTDKDFEMLGLSETNPLFEYEATLPLLTGDKDGYAYAGKVFMTINPTSANFNNLKLSVVNTKDEESFFKLENVGLSQVSLQWGYTRATQNGFYAADAYVKNTDLKNVERPFNEAAIKDLAVVAKNQFKAIADGMMSAGHTGLDELATSVYDVIRTLRLEKSGLKCQYQDVNDQTQAVYSQYNLAATALKPLGLDFGKDFHYVTVPGYERVENLLASIDRQLKNKVHTAFQSLNNSQLIEMILKFNIKNIALKDLDPSLVAKFEITVGDDVKIDGLTYHMVLGENSSIPVRFAQPLTVDGTTITSIPSNLLIDTANPAVTVPTLVVSGDVTTGNPVPCQLVIPVQNDAKVNYVWYDMAEVTNFTTNFTAGGTIVIDGKNVANVSGSTLTSTGSNINLSQVIDLSSSTTPVLHLEFTYDLRNEIQDIWGQTQDVVSDVNKMMTDLKKIIDEANNTLAKINNYEKTIDDAIDSVLGGKGVGKLHKYLDKINDIIVNAVNGINYQLRPFMVTEDANGFKLISGTKTYPTEMSKTDLKIYATSKTMEILVPFARKHIAVTNVFKGGKSAQDGDADCLAKLKAANTGEMNTVLDGNQRMIDVKGLVSGYTYEIAYSALDFRGNMATRRGYILIK